MTKLIAAAAMLAHSTALATPGFEVKDGGTPDNTADAITKIAQAFEAFKVKNDERLAEIEKKGSSDVVTTEQVDKINAEITRLSDIQTELQKKAARPAIGRDGKEITPEAKAHKDAFSQFLRKGTDQGLKDIEQKALSMATGADGSFTLPEEIDRMVQDLVKETSPIRSIANVVTVGTSDYKKLVNLHGTASGWVGETAARPETNTPQFAEIAPPMGEVYANPAASQVMLDDSFVDVESWLAGEIALEFAKAEGAAFISGNGTNRPRGFLAGSAPVATADGARAFGVLQYIPSLQAAALPTTADVYLSLVYALKAAHRQGANWVIARAVLAEIRKLKDTTNQYLWAPGLGDGQPATLLGFGITEAEDMPAVAANAFPVAFGNFRAGYTIVDRPTGVSLRDPFTNKPYVMFYTTKRVGGALVDSEAIKVLKIAAS